MNLAFDLERRTAEAGDRIALIFDDGREFSFADLDGWASRMAGALKELGVADGDHVALYLRNSPELVCSLFALWKIAAVPVTISALYGATELAASMNKAGAVAVISDQKGLANMQAAAASMTQAVIGGVDLPAGVADLDQLAANHADGLRAPDLPGDYDAVVLFTGGTTGAPKAVAMTHGGTFDTMSRLARAAKGGKKGPYPLVSEETSPNLIGLPLFHSGGQQTLLFALHVGRSILLMEKFSAQRTAELVARYRIDNLFLLPTMLYDIAHLAGEPDFSSVRSILVAGGEVSSALRALFEARFKIPLLNNYGSTETGHIAGWTGSDIKAGGWLPGSVGRVYDGVELEIRDDKGVAVAHGEAGEICVRTTVSSGYVDGSSETLVDESGWIASGDIGYLNDDKVLFLVGRKREMIKCGGFQVWPTELEEELLQHPAVVDVAVVGAADERMGEIPMAFVVAIEDVSADDLIEFARARQAHYKAIRAVRFIEELPRTAAGKIDRKALRLMSENG